MATYDATPVDNTTAALADIADAIGQCVKNTVESAWRIGSLLNEAKAIHGDNNNAFGAWRAPVLERYGIQRRTAARMQSLAEYFPSFTDVPQDGGLSVLYAIVSPASPPRAQQYLLDQLRAGEKLTVRDAEQAIIDVRQMERARVDADTEWRVAPGIEAPDGPREDAAAAGDDPAPEPPRERIQANGDVDADLAWAEGVWQQVRRMPAPRRTQYIATLVSALVERGAVEVGEGVEIVPANGRPLRFEVRS